LVSGVRNDSINLSTPNIKLLALLYFSVKDRIFISVLIIFFVFIRQKIFEKKRAATLFGFGHAGLGMFFEYQGVARGVKKRYKIRQY
tara:strand:+ start:8949 stop:9209 length:261 start_codon:yes stop_codon:yes gene_type:complete